MSTGGLSSEEKTAHAYQDDSYRQTDAWREIFRNMCIAALVTLTVWVLVSILRESIHYSTHHLFHFTTEHAYQWSAVLVIFALLVGSALVRFLLLQSKSWHDAKGNGTAESILYFHSTYRTDKDFDDEAKTQERYRRPTVFTAIRRVIMTFLTVGTGGSGGIEGPVIPVGESCGAAWSKLFKFKSPRDLRVLQVVGIATAMSTLLNTPLAAALFAEEVVFGEGLVYRSFFYSLIGAVIAFVLNSYVIDVPSIFTAPQHASTYHFREYLEVCVVAVLCCAPSGIGVSVLFSVMKRFLDKMPLLAKMLVGAFATALIAVVLWFAFHIEPSAILGVGEETLHHVMDAGPGSPLTVWWLLLIMMIGKLLATGFTLNSGGSAGLLIPAMYIGGVMGAMIFHLFALLHVPLFSSNADLFIVTGIAAALVSVIEVPLATIVFIMEGFGNEFGPPAIVACTLCYWFAKRFHLYAKQITNGVIKTR